MKFQFFRAALVAVAAFAFAGTAAAQSHTSKAFSGAKVNGGTVTHSLKDGRNVLSVSDDFVVPDTPDPHWQIVDSKGRVYLLDRLPLKGDRVARAITLPAYIADVAKVQIYCAWAEAVLGEAPFAVAMKLTH
jgi:parvulin-like peptidyl-prolyl isomerase